MQRSKHGQVRSAAVVAGPAAAGGSSNQSATGAPYAVALRWLAFFTLVLGVGWTQTSVANEAANKGILWSVDWSADGKSFAVGGAWTGIFDARTLQRIPSAALDSLEPVSKVRWHPRLPLLAISGGAAGTTVIYDARANRMISLAPKDGTRGISWSPDGKRLATAGNDGALQIWRADGKLLHTVKPPKGKSLTGVAWHPKEDKIVTVGEFIMLHDGRGRILRQITHRPEAKGPCLLLCAEWHPSGEFFVVGDYGNPDTGDAPAIQFWTSEGKLLRKLETEGKAPLRNVGWNPNGSLLASASDSLRIWSKEGQLKHVGKSPDLLWGMRWSREGTRLLTSSHEGRVTLWTVTAEVSKMIVQPPDGADGGKPTDP